MPWLLVDLLLVLLGLGALAVVSLRVWRGVKELGRTVSDAGTALGDATDALDRVQQLPRPDPAPGSTAATVTAPGTPGPGAHAASRRARR